MAPNVGRLLRIPASEDIKVSGCCEEPICVAFQPLRFPKRSRASLPCSNV
jgi:hypothetical protein